MPKAMKKKSKSSKTATKTEPVQAAPAPVEVTKKAPAIEPGMVHIAMEQEDLRTFANLMSIVVKTFEQLALEAAQANDEQSYAVLQARQQLSSVFAEKLASTYRMPEPISRDFH